MAGKILLWGAKAQARIIAAELSRQGMPPDFIFDSTLDCPEFLTQAEFCNSKNSLLKVLPECSRFVVCMGGAHGAQRAAVSDELMYKWGLEPLSVISPYAHVDQDAIIGKGVQIMAGVQIGLAAEIGDFSLINTNATVDHETQVGRGVHIMGSAAVAGRIKVYDYSTVGTNATIIPDLAIGRGAQIGAGALIRNDVEENAVMVGVPASILRYQAPSIDLRIFD